VLHIQSFLSFCSLVQLIFCVCYFLIMYYALQSLSNAAALLLISGVVLYTKYWILCACVLCIYSNIGYYMHIICTVVMHGTKDDFWHLEGMPPLTPF